MAEEQEGRSRGLSRRQMIKASAVAGAAAWTAPVIVDSLASPAAAASGGPCAGFTTYYFQIASGASCTTSTTITTSGPATCRVCTEGNATNCCDDPSSKVPPGSDLVGLIGFSAPQGCGPTQDPVSFSVNMNCKFVDARGARTSGCVPPCGSGNCFSGINTNTVSATKGGQDWTFFQFVVVCS